MQNNEIAHPMTRLLRGYGVNGRNLAVALGCAEITARKKLYDPDKLTLGDLAKIKRVYMISSDELRERVIS